MRDPQLWQRLQAFRLDDPSARFAFSDRLRREQRWSARFTARAIDEYRRFVYLAMTAGHPVTPSQAVDEVWHLHLCYTRSYWHGLCRDVLGRELHHGPTMGGDAEAAKYDDQYRQTLRSYEREFGGAPAELWPEPAVRFGRQSARPERRIPRGLLAAALAAVAVLAAGCNAVSENWAGLVMLGLGAVGVVVVMVHLVLAAKRGQLDSGAPGDPGGADHGGGACGVSHHGHDDDGAGGSGDDGCGGGGCGD